MNKTIKSETRRLLFSMISKFKGKQEEKQAEFNQDCLRVVKEFIENLKDVAGVGAIVRKIQKLSDLEQTDRIITQKQYFGELESFDWYEFINFKPNQKGSCFK